MNKIQQYLRDREEGFDRKFVNLMTIIIPIQPRGEESTTGHKLVERTPEVKSFHSETIKGLLQMLVEEYDKLPVEWVIKSSGVKGIIDGRATPFISKQETIDRLLEIK